MDPEVVRESVDPLGQKGHLDFGRSGIPRCAPKIVNNLLLGQPKVESGWLLFDVKPVQLAVGENLVGVRVKDRDPKAERLSIEKLELSVRYR